MNSGYLEKNFAHVPFLHNIWNVPLLLKFQLTDIHFETSWTRQTATSFQRLRQAPASFRIVPPGISHRYGYSQWNVHKL